MAERDSRWWWRTAPGVRHPPLYYGWIVIGTLAITEPISWGILFYSFGVMLTPIQQEMGWSQAELTGAFSLMLLISGITAVPVGRWLDQHGARGLMTLGSCLATLALIAWAQVQTLVGFYLIWMTIGVITAMILYEPAFAVAATWFVRQRSQALTVVTFGGGLASVIFVPLITWLVQLYGWRTTLWILAAILATTTIPLHALLLRRAPDMRSHHPDGTPRLPTVQVDQATNAQTDAQHVPVVYQAERTITLDIALRQRAFWLLSIAFALSNLSAFALAVHLLPFLTQQGYTPTFAALTASVLGGSQIPGRLIFGPVGSRLSLRIITAVLFTMMTCGLLILWLAPTTWIILAGAILFGMGSGASSPARAALVGEFYGTTNYGKINGMIALVLTLARAGAPVAMGLLYTWTGGYTAVFWVLILSAVGAVGGILLTRKPIL